VPYEIEFYEDDSGSKPCLEWVRGLDVRKRRVLGTALREILQQQGISVCGSPFGSSSAGGCSSSDCARRTCRHLDPHPLVSAPSPRPASADFGTNTPHSPGSPTLCEDASDS